MNIRLGLYLRRVVVLLVALVALLVVWPAFSGHLLSGYGANDREFVEAAFGSKHVFYHQRMLDGAIVEKDYIVYQFDKDTDELLARKSHWRDDLPEHLPPGLISRETAESMVDGKVLFSSLYIISPESDVYPLEPPPDNPCWVVRSAGEGCMAVTVIDALEGTILGYGVPPPYTAISLTGPWEFNPCSGGWTSWMNNAMNWFNTMGYDCEGVEWARENKVKGHIQSGQTAMFYELAHGGSDLFQSGCLGGSIPVSITANEIHTWIAEYTKMPFTFVGSCGGLCETGAGTFAYEFRKGEAESTAVVGYCDMAEPHCAICWDQSIAWQNALFSYMNQSYSVKDALDMANADYPACGLNSCMRFAGDEDWVVVPPVFRDPWIPDVEVVSPNGGEVLYSGTDHMISWIATDAGKIDSVAILLSTDGGSSFPDTIAAGEPNDSSFIWTVPDMDSKTARIRIVAIDAGLNQGSDLSDGDFTLWGTLSGMGISGQQGKPESVTLMVMGGNPVSANSGVVFGLPGRTEVHVGIYDVSGRLVRTLLNGQRSEGYHAARWIGDGASGTKLGPGVYFVRVDCPQGAATSKVVVAR